MSLPDEEKLLLDHEYDGIKELDNDLPPWWVWLFYLTIIFSAFYLGIPTTKAFYTFMAGNESTQPASTSQSKSQTAQIPQVALLDTENLAAGKELYDKNCANCHLPDGGGDIGPNLTDEFWMHGGSFADVYTVISEGVPEKGMVTWKYLLRPAQIHQVASFVETLRGTTPERAKAPQGTLWTPPAPASDTTTSTSNDSTKAATQSDNT